jgi:hypothetical protein
MGSRLSHLNLANNCTTGIQQIVVALAVMISFDKQRLTLTTEYQQNPSLGFLS